MYLFVNLEVRRHVFNIQDGIYAPGRKDETQLSALSNQRSFWPLLQNSAVLLSNQMRLWEANFNLKLIELRLSNARPEDLGDTNPAKR
jgi:hypothetical protein